LCFNDEISEREAWEEEGFRLRREHGRVRRRESFDRVSKVVLGWSYFVMSGVIVEEVEAARRE